LRIDEDAPRARPHPGVPETSTSGTPKRSRLTTRKPIAGCLASPLFSDATAPLLAHLSGSGLARRRFGQTPLAPARWTPRLRPQPADDQFARKRRRSDQPPRPNPPRAGAGLQGRRPGGPRHSFRRDRGGFLVLPVPRSSAQSSSHRPPPSADHEWRRPPRDRQSPHALALLTQQRAERAAYCFEDLEIVDKRRFAGADVAAPFALMR
jgi:hypothetical protein